MHVLQVRKQPSGERLNLQLSESDQCVSSSPPCLRGADREKIHQTLYLLDRFAVSDGFYHELSMLNESLPRSYLVKGARKDLNDTIDIQRLSGPYEGTYRSFKAALQTEVSKLVRTYFLNLIL